MWTVLYFRRGIRNRWRKNVLTNGVEAFGFLLKKIKSKIALDSFAESHVK